MTMVGSAPVVISSLKQVPAAVWGTIVGSILTLPGLIIALRHSRMLQASQLSHDSKERNRERQMAWRREVYLESAESVSRLSSLIGRVADLNVADPELSRA